MDQFLLPAQITGASMFLRGNRRVTTTHHKHARFTGKCGFSNGNGNFQDISEWKFTLFPSLWRMHCLPMLCRIFCWKATMTFISISDCYKTTFILIISSARMNAILLALVATVATCRHTDTLSGYNIRLCNCMTQSTITTPGLHL